MPPGGRSGGLTVQLAEVHAWLRDALAELRADLRPGRDLRAHCLTFCTALERHHTGEDAHLFGHLAQRYPELRPALDALRSDHAVVSGILREIEKLVDGERDPERLRRALDGLSALLESHFRYEERALAAALEGAG